MIYFDLDKQQLVKPPGEGGVVNSVTFIRGDWKKLEVTFLKDGEEVTEVTNIVAVIKEAPGEISTSLALCETWEADEAVFSGVLSLNGASLNTLIAEKISINLFFEINCFYVGDGPITAAAVKCLVKNDLWRGTEGTPLEELPDPEEWLVARAAPIYPPSIAISSIGLLPGPALLTGLDARGYPLYDTATTDGLTNWTVTVSRVALSQPGDPVYRWRIEGGYTPDGDFQPTDPIDEYSLTDAASPDLAEWDNGFRVTHGVSNPAVQAAGAAMKSDITVTAICALLGIPQYANLTAANVALASGQPYYDIALSKVQITTA